MASTSCFRSAATISVAARSFCTLPLLYLSPFQLVESFVAPKTFLLPGRSLAVGLGALSQHEAYDALLRHLPSLTLVQGDLEEGLGGNAVDLPSQETFDAMTSGGVMDSVIGGLQSLLLFVTALVFGGLGLAYIFAAFLIPKAAEQLEKETKELAPELWDEYQAKLEEGETLAQRPDLLKELGDQVQPLIDAKIARAYEEQLRENEKVMGSLPPPSASEDEGKEQKRGDINS